MNRVRLDLRLLLAAGLALIAGLGVFSLTRPPERVVVLVAADPLPAGVPLHRLALREVSVSPLDGLVLGSQASEFAEWTLAVPLAAGAPITASVLTPPAGTLPDVIAVTLERGHAVQGLLVAGDRVDIYVTDELGTRLLSEAIAVISAEVGEGGLGGSDVSLLLAVDDLVAPELVAAMQTAELDLVRVSG